MNLPYFATVITTYYHDAHLSSSGWTVHIIVFFITTIITTTTITTTINTAI